MTAVMMILIVIIIMNVRGLEQVILHDNGVQYVLMKYVLNWFDGLLIFHQS